MGVKVSTYFSKHRWILVAAILVIACCAVGLCCFLFRTPLNVQIERANLRLTERKLPTLPQGAQNIKWWTGGVFAKYMDVKFTAPEGEAVDFFRRAGAEWYVSFHLVQDHYEVVDERFQEDFPESEKAEKLSDVKFSLKSLKRGKGFGHKGWAKSVYQIRRGLYYGRHGQTAGFDLLYDLDREVLYIFWYYS